MVELAEPKVHEHVVDLGAGDGRISIAFAQAGTYVTAYEIDNTLIQLSQKNLKKAHVEEYVAIKNKDFWQADLSKFDIIAVYPFPDIMEDLEKKLWKELKPGARIVTNYYQFPNVHYSAKKENVYLYSKV